MSFTEAVSVAQKMAQFSGLSGGGVALPIGVLIIVLTMAYSPVTVGPFTMYSEFVC